MSLKQLKKELNKNPKFKEVYNKPDMEDELLDFMIEWELTPKKLIKILLKKVD